MDMRIELITLPASDADRTRDFFAALGWNIDFDREVDAGLRFVQVTPPGSACSIAFGKGLSQDAPGSSHNIQLVIRDADAALALLREAGVDADDVDEQPWGRFVAFRDPDGNVFTLQELPEWSQGYANRPA